MYINNDDERKQTPGPIDIPAENMSINESPRYEVINKELTYNESIISEASSNDYIHNEQFNNIQSYGGQAHDDPGYPAPAYPEPPNSQQTYTRPAYTGLTHTQQTYNDQTQQKHGEAGWNMYSPGICVNQPYPRTRESDNSKHAAHRDRGQGVAGFLRAVALVIVCALFSGAAAYVVMDYRFNRGDFTQHHQVILGSSVIDRRQDEDSTVPVATKGDGMSASDIYDMARSQVVGIITEAPGFFGFPGSSGGGTTPVSGSGFIISGDGYILTNYHVIELAQRNNLPINVVLSDGTSYEAKVIGYEASNDVAVIKINATGLSPAMIGNSDRLRVGQTVYAIGNPFGDLVYTMTDGIISALDRVVSVEGKSISTFQFSAAVNSGNSGGPIYNTDGEVLGIVTAKVVRGNVEGIGFAIPINDAIDIATELIEHGYITGRPLIGIVGQTVSAGHAEYYGWVQGVYVRSVSLNSAAEAAGIVEGDIITALAGIETISMEALKFELRSHRAGDTTDITVWRNGEYLEMTITFTENMHAGQPERPDLEVDPPDPSPENP